MKQITDKEYQEWQKYKEDKLHGRLITSDFIRMICESNEYNPEKIGTDILNMLVKIQHQS